MNQFFLKRNHFSKYLLFLCGSSIAGSTLVSASDSVQQASLVARAASDLQGNYRYGMEAGERGTVGYTGADAAASVFKAFLVFDLIGIFEDLEPDTVFSVDLTIAFDNFPGQSRKRVVRLLGLSDNNSLQPARMAERYVQYAPIVGEIPSSATGEMTVTMDLGGLIDPNEISPVNRYLWLRIECEGPEVEGNRTVFGISENLTDHRLTWRSDPDQLTRPKGKLAEKSSLSGSVVARAAGRVFGNEYISGMAAANQGTSGYTGNDYESVRWRAFIAFDGTKLTEDTKNKGKIRVKTAFNNHPGNAGGWEVVFLGSTPQASVGDPLMRDLYTRRGVSVGTLPPHFELDRMYEFELPDSVLGDMNKKSSGYYWFRIDPLKPVDPSQRAVGGIAVDPQSHSLVFQK